MAIVDVRDVAEAHYQALIRDNLGDYQRISVTSVHTHLRQLGKILHEEFAKYGYPVTIAELNDINHVPARFKPSVGKTFTVDNEKSKALLGLDYKIDERESVVEMIKECARLGIIEDKIS